MSENQIEGGTGAALAAHSKDASVPGTTPASSATGDNHDGAAAAESAGSNMASRLSGQTRAAADKLTSSVSNAAAQARQRFSQQGYSTEQVGSFVRENPVTALLVTGMLGLILGSFIARR